MYIHFMDEIKRHNLDLIQCVVYMSVKSSVKMIDSVVLEDYSKNKYICLYYVFVNKI